jgi:hypothetical protein
MQSLHLQTRSKVQALNAQIALQDLRLRLDLAGRPLVGDIAIIDDGGALRQG